MRRLGAYGRMRALALATERARALGPTFNPDAFVSGSAPTRRRLIAAGGAIAATALVGVAGWNRLRGGARYQTGKGQMQVVALSDGSVLTLNTDSEISVDFSRAERSVQMIKGEVLFNVAKDPGHPFVVAASDTQVKVLGTSFTVRKLGTAPIQVLVCEGVVEVSKPTEVKASTIRISANTRALAAPDRPQIAARSVAPAELHRELAWQEGQIAFEVPTLAQAASEFARYSDVKVVIDSPALANEEIAGLFKADDPIGFAQTIAISLNARAEISEGEVRLTR